MRRGRLTIDVRYFGRTHHAGTFKELIVTQSEWISVLIQKSRLIALINGELRAGRWTLIA
jgi:hypothetical protein